MIDGFMAVDLNTGKNDGVYSERIVCEEIAEILRSRHPDGFWVVVQLKSTDPRFPKSILPGFHADV